VKLVVVSDAHLDARTAGVERFDEIRDSFDEAVEYALHCRSGAGADLFVFCGDLCDPDDGRDVLRASAYVVDAAVRLATHRVKSLWISGNHDVAADGVTTTLDALEGLEQIFDAEDERERCDDRELWAPRVALRGPVVLELPGSAPRHPRKCLVAALPYSPEPYGADSFLYGTGRKAAANGVPLLVFGHLMLPGMHPGSEAAELARGRDRAFPLDALARLRSENFEPALLVNGHYHRRQSVMIDGWAFEVPGSLARLTFAEEENVPGFLAIDVAV